MPSAWTPIDTAEAALLAFGGALLVFSAARIATKGAWQSSLGLGPPEPCRIEPLDPALAVFAVFFVPQLLYALILGRDAASETSATTQPLPAASQIMVAFLGQLLACGAIVSMGAWRHGWRLSAWGLSAARLPRQAARALVAYVMVWPLCFGLLHLTVYVMTRITPDFSPPEHQTIRILVSGESGTAAAVLTVISAVVLAPVNEELLFRGMLQPLLAASFRSAWGAIIVCAVAFGLFHYPLVHTMPALALFGLVLGWLRARSGSLTLVILLHAIFNAKTLTWLTFGPE
ncbi:MAG: hypothetical protein DCC65_10535 [Planctomycetota bacterium]|nr:MAG: hypothetical protein DCC65_10535 [Planctomycetota bacterium]